VAEDFDLLAASLRADAADVDAFFAVLAEKLAEAFPGQVDVERGGMFGRGGPRAVAVRLGDEVFEAERERRRVTCRRRKVVRGIALKTEELGLEAWIDALSAALVAEAEGSERASSALRGLLGA
jgi:hypothetical protein